jgi:hypothetical protein
MRAKLLPTLAFLGLSPLGMESFAASAPGVETVDATIPLEVLESDPALAAGGIPLQRTWSSPRIAMQPARIPRGAVLTKNGDLLMLALLEPVGRSADGKARLDGPADRVAWCAAPKLISNFMSCYQDLDSDGRFETSRTGLLGAKEVLSLSRLQGPKTIEPLPYRPATQDELPLFQVGYRACGATISDPHTFTSPFRFETVVRLAEGMHWPSSGRCDNLARLIETRPDGAKLYGMDRFKVEVREKDEKELATMLVEGLAPGTVLAHVRSSWPLTDATERPKEADAIAASNSFLVATGKPTIATQARPGEQIFSLEVRHALSGRLSVASEPRAKRDPLRLPEGTPVYGIAMRSNLTPWADAEVIWCTPVKQPKGTKPFCFAPNLGSAALVTTYSTPFTVRGIAPSGPSRNLPVVEPGPADFGAPLVLAVKVISADKKSVSIDWSLAPRGQWYSEKWSFLRARDQTSLLLVGSLLIKISPSADGQSFEITTRGEIDDGSPVDLPADAVRLMR